MKAFINSREDFRTETEIKTTTCYSHHDDDGHDVGGQMKTETQMFML
jgi:hypothetical protein